MYLERIRTRRALLLGLDGAVVIIAFVGALALRAFHEAIPLLRLIPATVWDSKGVARSEYALPLVASLLAVVALVRASGVYLRPATPKLSAALRVYLRAVVLAIILTSVLVFTLKISLSRLFFGYFFVLSFVLLVGKQSLCNRLLRSLRRSGENRKRTLIVGEDLAVAWLGRIIRNSYADGYELVGVLVTGPAPAANGEGLRILGSAGDTEDALETYAVDEVFVVGSARDIVNLAPVAQLALERGHIVSIASTMTSGGHGLAGRVTEFHGIPMISYGPMPRDEIRNLAKRGLDIAVGTLGLVAALPLGMCIACAIKLTSRGPVLFAQERLGFHGRRFRLLKFRSMISDAEHVLRRSPELHAEYLGNDFKIPAGRDPRVTAVGRFLRKSSLDELPQIWNVLKGEMTLVGPRPIVPEEVEKYHPYVDILLSVKPGLTGSWQVSGRSQVPYPDRAFLDFDYVASHSLTNDLGILLKTVPAIVRRRGAH